MSSRNVLWIVFFLFAAGVLYFNWHPGLFAYTRPLAPAKFAIWAAFIAFLTYTIRCSYRENLFKSVRSIAALHWGRQIGIDLYIGLSLSLCLVYLHQGPWIALLWLFPVFAYGNVATLFYVAIHFDALVARMGIS